MFTVSFLDSIYKLLIFGDLWRVAFPFVMKRYVRKSRRLQQKTVAELKNKKQITVAFFLQTPTTWKYDKIYRRMEQSERFLPVVVACPYNMHLNYSKTECLNVLQKTEEFAAAQGYNYISAFDHEQNKWLNVRKKINPDIVFFTKPYKDTLPDYYIYKFRDKITCYSGYGICNVNIYRLNYNLPLNNLLYHFFVESDLHLKIAQQYSDVKGENALITGSPAAEPLIDGHAPKDVWKPQNKEKKRIIWAPHHTIDYLFNFSNFLIYCDFMLALAKKYEDSIQFVFKPHPVLKFKLINLWGEAKTNEYYEKWRNLPNTQIEEGYYIDLFLSSDAMIHDCASFTSEYLHTLKPVCFTVREEENVRRQWNPFGMQAFELHYHAYNEQDIENFIENVVLGGNDTKATDRKTFFENYLYPKDGIMPSEKIFKILENEVT
jgi:hypothetical protein